MHVHVRPPCGWCGLSLCLGTSPRAPFLAGGLWGRRRHVHALPTYASVVESRPGLQPPHHPQGPGPGVHIRIHKEGPRLLQDTDATRVRGEHGPPPPLPAGEPAPPSWEAESWSTFTRCQTHCTIWANSDGWGPWGAGTRQPAPHAMRASRPSRPPVLLLSFHRGLDTGGHTPDSGTSSGHTVCWVSPLFSTFHQVHTAWQVHVWPHARGPGCPRERGCVEVEVLQAGTGLAHPECWGTVGSPQATVTAGTL